jgi:putative IMPACT (imprinted ancient) family translation regulator
MLDVLRHQDLEGVLATVVRYFGGIKLGAGGLVRAYTDSVAQALLQADKVAIVRHTRLTCTAPYAQEGMIRRELDAAGATLLEVTHGDAVVFFFSLAEAGAPALVARLNEAGHGRIGWQGDDET